MDADSGAHAGLDTPASGATPVPSPPASSGDAKAPPVAFSSGLTSSQAAELLSVHGKNELAESHKSKLRLLLEQARVSSRNNRRHNISRLAQFTAPMPCVIWCAGAHRAATVSLL